jgi:plasmid stabilization system protein ParE
MGRIRWTEKASANLQSIFEYIAKDSRFYEVDPDTLRALNPALGKPVMKGQRQVPKGYRLRLPADSVENPRISSAATLQRYHDLQE